MHASTTEMPDLAAYDVMLAYALLNTIHLPCVHDQRSLACVLHPS